MCKTTHGDDTAASHAYPCAARARSTAITLSGRRLHSTTHAPLVDVDDVCRKPGIIIIINLIKQQPHDVKPVGQRLWGSVRVRVWMGNRCVCVCVCVAVAVSFKDAVLGTKRSSSNCQQQYCRSACCLHFAYTLPTLAC